MTATLEQDRAAWLRDRTTYLGGNDIAAIAGCHPFQTAMQTYMTKKGLCEPQEETPAMRRGILLEPYVSQCYAEHEGIPLEFMEKAEGPVMHPFHSFLGVNPDYLCRVDESGIGVPANAKPSRFPCEIKTHSPFVSQHYGPPETDEAPAHEIIQATWQVHLLRMADPLIQPRCDLCVLFGVDDLRVYHIPYDEEFASELEYMAVHWWWEHMDSDVPPPITGSEADSKLLGRLYGEDHGGTLVATAELEERIVLLKEARTNRKRWEEAETTEENHIKEAMGQNAYLQSSQGKIAWKLAAPSTQWKSVAQALAERFGISARDLEALEVLHKGAASRRFTVPRGW